MIINTIRRYSVFTSSGFYHQDLDRREKAAKISLPQAHTALDRTSSRESLPVASRDDVRLHRRVRLVGRVTGQHQSLVPSSDRTVAVVPASPEKNGTCICHSFVFFEKKD